MTTGHGEPIQKQFAFEDHEHIVGVLCHDPRCLPEPGDTPQTPADAGPGPARRRAEPATATATGNGNGDGPARLPPPPYAIALTAGGKVCGSPSRRWRRSRPARAASVVRLDPAVPDDLVVGVEATDGTENVCLATRSARVLIFPVTEANVVSGAAKGVTAIKLDAKDRVLGFALANKMREGLTVRTSRGATQIVRATKYPVTGRGGRGYGILQRGSLEAVIHDEARPVPPSEAGG